MGCSYDLRDVIVGKIHFLLVRLKLRLMEIEIIRNEISDASPGFDLAVVSFNGSTRSLHCHLYQRRGIKS